MYPFFPLLKKQIKGPNFEIHFVSINKPVYYIPTENQIDYQIYVRFSISLLYKIRPFYRITSNRPPLCIEKVSCAPGEVYRK